MGRMTEADRHLLRSAIYLLARDGDFRLPDVQRATNHLRGVDPEELARALDFAERAAWIKTTDQDTYTSTIRDH